MPISSHLFSIASKIKSNVSQGIPIASSSVIPGKTSGEGDFSIIFEGTLSLKICKMRSFIYYFYLISNYSAP